MNPKTIMVIVALLNGALIPINGAVLGYVVNIERRLTRLETRDELRKITPMKPAPVVVSDYRTFADSTEGNTMKKGKKAMTEAQAALAAFDKRHEGKDLTDPQEKERAGLKRAVDAEKFVTLGNVRITKALNAIDGLSKLARLPHSKEQIETLKGEFESALKACFSKFDTKAENGAGKAVRKVL
jgi:hypothetical protein